MSKIKFLDLGSQPIANNFLDNKDKIKNEYKFNLSVVFDEETKLVSLESFVKPELMFNDSYVYYSSLSETMRSHFYNVASLLKKDFSPKSILEIGSNDGVFLKNFLSNEAVSVEPCGNFARITTEMGYNTYDKFWSRELAEKITTSHGKQDLIFSANCMCHIQNLKSAFDSVAMTLSKTGVFVFEDPSIMKMIERGSYDQIYDEHAHIFSVTALQNVLNSSGLEVFKVQNLSVHGGSNRIFACPVGTRSIDISVKENLDREDSSGINSIEAYLRFSKKVFQSKNQLVQTLSELKRKGYKIVSYGATSKSTTVFNYCQIGTNLIDYIVDTTHDKQGKLSPGMHIPVVSPEEGFNTTVDYAFLGAWNYEKEILNNEKEFLKNGRFITHVPHVRFVKN